MDNIINNLTDRTLSLYNRTQFYGVVYIIDKRNKIKDMPEHNKNKQCLIS